MPRQTLTFLTPCFCGGADSRNGEAELRVPSVRGQLRYWTRLLAHNLTDTDAPPRAEHQLFGGIRAKQLKMRHPLNGQLQLEAIASRFVFRLRLRSADHPSRQAMCPHDPEKARRSAFPSGTEFDLEWNTAPSAGTGSEADFCRAFKAWVLLGGLGVRANRAAGSVWRMNWTPSEPEYLREIKSLWPDATLPPFLTVEILPRATASQLSGWKPPGAGSPAWKKTIEDPRELLRAIATDTLDFGNDHGGAFGYGGADGRKASPIKFKLGHFKEGFRLIAIVDRRNGRDGKLKAAIAELVANEKPIGSLLKGAGLG